ncbi:uncharacterized protein F4807DRAFT_462761 [Annulohypoxylon truncatum]|uniref:uncharacterized protein n=1 Tax=Annulohypoxylon truncatum TaxID=327061 RepID=UPI002007CCDB|nr:uncharacterized protein F4807DRAFT_462761 [Annulohypoxylon truncatum]KAI1207311.1 hypothetical protein F4807DRAFT_462761 [Annulohypoxylon truncatum]
MAPTGGHRSSTTGINANSNGNVNVNGNPVSDYQVAASNSTLNTWVGGRRQPSWLTNAKPVKPTPRPPQPPPKQPITTTQEPTRPVPSTVDTTSQAGIVPVPKTSTTSSSASTAARATTHTAPPRRPHPVPSPRHPPTQTPTQTQTTTTLPTSTSAAHTILPSPAPSDEPSPDVPELQVVSIAPTTKAHFVLDTTADNTRGEQPDIRVSTVRARTNSRQSKDISPTPRTSTPTNTALHTPPTPNIPTVPTVPSVPLVNAQMAPKTVPPLEQPELPPAKRRCTQQPKQQFLESIGAFRILQDRIRSVGGESGLDIQIERPRYQLLTEACKDGDLFFVAMHQLFCVWAIDQSSVHRLCHPGLHNPALVDNAFGVMGTLLKSNSKLRLEHVQWFASFPDRLSNMQNVPVYQQTIMRVLDFLTRVAEKWVAVHREHQVQGYPLLVSELIYDLFVLSPILQAIMFRASRRSLGIADGCVAAQMEAIFKKDQTNHLSADGTLRDRPAHSLYTEYNRSLIAKYKTFFAQNQAQGQPPQVIPQGQQSVHYGTMNYQQQQQPGLAYPPHINQHVDPRRYSQSPANTPTSVHSPAFFQSPVPAHFTLSSNQNMPVGTSPQTQWSPPAPQAEVMSSHSPHPMYHQAQAQFIQQASPGVPSTSAMSNPAISHGNSYNTAQPIEQWQQGYQNFNGQHMVFQGQVPTSTGQVIADGSVLARHNATNAQQPAMYLANQAQVPTRPQQSTRSQPRQKNGLTRQDRLIPPRDMRIGVQDYPHSPYDRISVEGSLHQAHLRSPKRIPLVFDPKKPERFYQAIKSLVLPPTVVTPQSYVQDLQFAVPEPDYARITREETRPGEFLPVSVFSNGSLRYRVRCCYRDASAPPFTESAWVTTDTIWPEHIFMELNSQILGIMRKAHHSKDLPAEASQHVVTGNNVLRLTIPKDTPIPSGKKLFIAVEQVEVLSHSAVLNMVKSQGNQPSSITRDIIKNRLSSKYADDDELAMVDDLSIDVTDPFSRAIFNIPVRGNMCAHLECFDLETWLNTRLGKKSPCQCGHLSGCANCPREPSFVDKWRCPLCDGDARPFSLRIDGFLVEVRSKLEQENKLGTKSILVDQDGNWKPKEEPHDDDSEDESDEGGGGPKGKQPSRSSTTTLQRDRPPIEVIELDDD